MNILHYTFFQDALLDPLLASIVCGLIGTYTVTRRLVFISGGVTRAPFGGIGLGVFLGFNPIVSVMLFVIFSAYGIQWMSHRSNVREDFAIALFWTSDMSTDIICRFLTLGLMPDLPSFLFDNILTIFRGDLLLLAVPSLLLLAISILSLRPTLSIAFDPRFARSQKLPVLVIEYMTMILITMIIASILRMARAVLAISLLTIPQMTANLLIYSYKQTIVYSILVGRVDRLLSLTFNYLLSAPSGTATIFVGIIIYALLKAIKVLIFKFNQRGVSPS